MSGFSPDVVAYLLGYFSELGSLQLKDFYPYWGDSADGVNPLPAVVSRHRLDSLKFVDTTFCGDHPVLDTACREIEWPFAASLWTLEIDTPHLSSLEMDLVAYFAPNLRNLAIKFRGFDTFFLPSTSRRAIGFRSEEHTSELQSQ